MATNNSINASTPFAINKGGTSANTKTAAFNALSPITTKGDLIGFDGTNNTRLAVGTNGQVLMAGSGATLGFDWTTTNILNSNTISNATLQMTPNQSYITSAASQVVYTLPATMAVGQIIQVVGFSANGWQIAQNAGQSIHMNSLSTTTGVTGTITSQTRYDTIQFICVSTDTDFVVLYSSGVLTII